MPTPSAPSEAAYPSRRIWLVGAGRLGAAIEAQLVAQGALLHRIARRDPEHDLLASGHLDDASVLILANDDDAGNVDLALAVRRVRPDLPLVVRLFDAALVEYLQTTLSGITVVSVSSVAAPVFAAEALQAIQSVGKSVRPPWRLLAAGPRSWPVDRVLLGALAALSGLVISSAFFYARVLNLRMIDAFYFVWTTVMTVGYGDISLRHAPDGAKLFGMFLMLSGAAFLAILFALLSDWVLRRRLELLQGRVQVRSRGHVVIAGAGNMGVRVAESLARSGCRVVVVERSADARNVASLRAAGHHVIIADATSDSALVLARLDHASALLALTDSDAVNLTVALLAKKKAPFLPVLMRSLSPELSAHVSARKDAIALSPIAVAAAAFASAALRACPGHGRTPSAS